MRLICAGLLAVLVVGLRPPPSTCRARQRCATSRSPTRWCGSKRPSHSRRRSSRTSCSTSATSTFFPHVLAVRVGHDRRVSEPRSRLPRRVLVSRRQAVRARALPGRRGQARAVRPAGTEPHLLQHPSAHGGLHHGRRHAVLRGLGSGRAGSRSRTIPAGTYTYHAWRPGGDTLNGSAAVRAGSIAGRAMAMNCRLRAA